MHLLHVCFCVSYPNSLVRVDRPCQAWKCLGETRSTDEPYQYRTVKASMFCLGTFDAEARCRICASQMCTITRTIYWGARYAYAAARNAHVRIASYSHRHSRNKSCYLPGSLLTLTHHASALPFLRFFAHAKCVAFHMEIEGRHTLLGSSSHPQHSRNIVRFKYAQASVVSSVVAASGPVCCCSVHSDNHKVPQQRACLAAA